MAIHRDFQFVCTVLDVVPFSLVTQHLVVVLSFASCTVLTFRKVTSTLQWIVLLNQVDIHYSSHSNLYFVESVTLTTHPSFPQGWVSRNSEILIWNISEIPKQVGDHSCGENPQASRFANFRPSEASMISQYSKSGQGISLQLSSLPFVCSDAIKEPHVRKWIRCLHD